MTDLLLDSTLDDERREYLQVVKSSAEALLAVLNDILDFSRIEAGKLQVENIPFNLWRTLGDSLQSLAVDARDKGLGLICDIGAQVPQEVVGDPGGLRQILLKLIDNAIKFTEHGEIVLTAALVAQDEAGVFCQFSVRDTGIGIPAEKLESVFAAFTQLDSSMTRRYGGTGLGLSIAQRLAEALGGRIWAESEPGRGSTFHFTARFGRCAGTGLARSAQPEAQSTRVAMSLSGGGGGTTLTAFDYAEALRQADPEVVEIVAGAYLDQYSDGLHRLRAGCAADDRAALLFVTHALRGTLGLFRARPAEDLTRRIEQLATHGKCSEVHELIEQLAQELDRLAVVLAPVVRREQQD